MARKECTVKITVVSVVNGNQLLRDWDDIPAEEQKTISREITDRFMKAAGYCSANREEKKV